MSIIPVGNSVSHILMHILCRYLIPSLTYKGFTNGTLGQKSILKLTASADSCNSVCTIAIVENTIGDPIFSRSRSLLGLSQRVKLLSDITGSGKSKMAAAKPDVSVYRRVQ